MGNQKKEPEKKEPKKKEPKKKEPKKKEPKKKEPKKKEPKEKEPKEKEAEPFISMCSMPFDPKPTAECYTMCQIESPNDFKACLKNFEASEITPPITKKKKTAGTNKWGRRLGTQCAAIEDILDNDPPMTTADIAKKANCSVSRVRRHFLRLIHKEQQTKILIDDKQLVFLPQRFKTREGISAYIKK